MPMPNVLGTLMHHPALAGPFLTYNNVLLQTPDARSPAAGAHGAARRVAHPLRSTNGCSTCASPDDVGITADEIAAVARDSARTHGRRSTPTCSPRPINSSTATASTTTRGVAWPKQLDERQIVELVFVVGTYTGLAMAFNSFGLQLDPELRRLAAASLPEFEE